MQKTIYLIFARKKDFFNVIYVGECDSTDDIGFFTKNSEFKCWIETSGSEQSLYLAILPLFESLPNDRMRIIQKIIKHYKPNCNKEKKIDTKDYSVKTSTNIIKKASRSDFICPCCGSLMNVDKILDKTTMYRCSDCGLSDTRIDS